ncbi:homodimeric glycerol 3-phosphate dehydrogenase (quinone) [Roseivirga ehrenbergii]|uniref:Glycerol-3-phosphate dehydrogenase n=1 Tax=Roseivirga ehrenbergii (strain DSM 102268 / JCM 13514 / KCTC 12282 / NCIMB 14502 / KMM 6017) TaxID=279360 RepID=A0A150XCE2_ROSEK|nr:glycerol-3-phosphate dehydrogenase/oxidase [Roseivirga ehrenbergii]KYG76362.1 glycerol-3-phosphate dehydrogenase [Roseivirga ehrenbergii]TCL00100.1 homodimeric glycerol 3-phosphate dehydrogenase (quinone) [Roseivirga ehrenbergii]
MNVLSSTNRKALTDTAKTQHYDLLIIGGGITGAGIALDAASRGLKTVLVEKNDFASGTSSKSTKLIHGGLRYLKQFEIALVREVGRERATLHKLIPNLVTSEKMLLPLIKDGTFGKLMTSIGLMVYDVLAGVEKVDQRKMLDIEETLEKEPLLSEENVEGGGIYAEYRTDDARLTIEIIKTASKFGAHCLNYVQADEFIYKEGKVAGVFATDFISGEKMEIKAKSTISAAGPWVDELRTKNHSLTSKHLHLTKGVHIVLPHNKFPLKQAIYFDFPDKRMVFAIPRGKITYIGTTDTDYAGDKDKILTTKADVEYLIKGTNHAFPKLNLKAKDVESSWAGVRPLIHEDGKSASEISRKDEIFESETGLISIAGGKLTGYRKMAEKVVDRLYDRLHKEEGMPIVETKTTHIDLDNGAFKNAKAVKKYRKSTREQLEVIGLEKYYAGYLVSNYGKVTDEIIEGMNAFDNKALHLKLIRSELRYCLENEMVFSIQDFYIRRTGRLYFDIHSIKPTLEVILKDFQNHFDWSAEKTLSEKEAMEKAIEEVSIFG